VDARTPGWLGEVMRVYPSYYAARLLGRRPPAPLPLPSGVAGALVVPGMFAPIRIYRALCDRLAALGVAASGLDFGLNAAGSIASRVARVRAAVDAHAATGGRVVLVAHSMGALVCARYLLEYPKGVTGFVSVCGVLGGIRRWTLAGWPFFPVVREMRRETGARLLPAIRALLAAPPVPMTLFQADRDEFVLPQPAGAAVVRLVASVTHNGPLLVPGALDEIAARVAAYATR
jgi:pimeloyl-ACP methyl ester carboxylesterase